MDRAVRSFMVDVHVSTVDVRELFKLVLKGLRAVRRRGRVSVAERGKGKGKKSRTCRERLEASSHCP
jgi:hypothetical protein